MDFVCAECKRDFRSAEALQDHFDRNHDDGDFDLPDFPENVFALGFGIDEQPSIPAAAGTSREDPVNVVDDYVELELSDDPVAISEDAVAHYAEVGIDEEAPGDDPVDPSAVAPTTPETTTPGVLALVVDPLEVAVAQLMEIFPDAEEGVLRRRLIAVSEVGEPLNDAVDAIVAEYADLKGKYPKKRKLKPDRDDTEPERKRKASERFAEPNLEPYLGRREFNYNYGSDFVPEALANIFCGFRMGELRLFARAYGRLADCVVNLSNELLRNYPDLGRAMLSRRRRPGNVPPEEAQLIRRSAGTHLSLHLVFPNEHLLTGALRRSPRSNEFVDRLVVNIVTLKTWRHYAPRPYNLQHQDEMAMVEEWLDWRLGIGRFQAKGDALDATPTTSISEKPTGGPSGEPSKNEENAAEEDQSEERIECQCCFGDYAFRRLVQCFEGHLFCRECMRNYAQSSISGQGKASLTCMAEDCGEGFPRSVLELCLDEKILKALDEREQEESVRLALDEDSGVAQCPHCTFKIFLPPENKVLKCQNPKCLRETCRVCQEEWDDDHFGVPCNEIEKTDETDLRKRAEEQMTKARLRFCHKCKTPLIKEEGCNKLTCRCGAKMCYICRTPIKDYSHFCQHAREPGKPCDKCNSCGLWSNPKEDDDRAIEEIRREAEAEKVSKGFVNSRKIGTDPGKPQDGNNNPPNRNPNRNHNRNPINANAMNANPMNMNPANFDPFRHFNFLNNPGQPQIAPLMFNPMPFQAQPPNPPQFFNQIPQPLQPPNAHQHPPGANFQIVQRRPNYYPHQWEHPIWNNHNQYF